MENTKEIEVVTASELKKILGFLCKALGMPCNIKTTVRKQFLSLKVSDTDQLYFAIVPFIRYPENYKDGYRIDIRVGGEYITHLTQIGDGFSRFQRTIHLVHYLNDICNELDIDTTN